MQRATWNRRRGLAVVARSIGLAAAFYLYVWLRVRPELFYLQNPRVFLFDSHFFHALVDRPGGVVDYVSAFLSPLFAWGWLGALVVTTLVALVCLATRGLIAAGTGAGGEIVFLLPAVPILMVLGQYCHPVRPCVGLSLVLGSAYLYVRLGRCRVALRLAALVIASGVVYFAAAGLYLIFALLCGWYELAVKREYRLGALCLLCAVAVPFGAAAWPLDRDLGGAFRGLILPDEQHWLAVPSSAPKAMTIYTGALLFPLFAAIAPAVRRRRSPASCPDDAGGRDGPPGGAGGPARGGWKARLAVLATMPLIVVLADVAAFDSPLRCLLEMEHHSDGQRWDDVLARAEQLPLSYPRACDPRFMYCVNRALYFRGGLLDRMFAYPQAIDTPSLTLIFEDIDTTAGLTPRQSSEVFFDLGRINESEQMAHEALELYGNRPEILKRLVYIYVIKGQPEAAERFLALLECSLLHRGWARRLRRRLDADPALSDEPLVASRRDLMVRRDSVGAAGSLEKLLEGLLEANPRNRMAFEYLMGHYLLARRLNKLYDDHRRFDAFDSPHFPRHVEEALLIYMAMTGHSPQALRPREIRPETWTRFGEFLRIERASRGDASAAFAALHPDFADTYFFSFVFGHNIAPLGVPGPPE